MGNESGCGENFKLASEAVKELDKSRLVHYEQMVDENGEFVPYLDVVSRMYCDTKYMEDFLSESKDPRPFILCEYCHSMGNGPGDLKEYFDEINKSEKFIGGFIWEWKDHGVKFGKGGYKYGGDFSEINNDSNFCIDGLIGPDLENKPSTIYLKQLYSGKSPESQKEKFKSITFNKSKLKIIDAKRIYTVKLPDSEYKIDKISGAITSIRRFNKEILKAPITINIARAPIDNERGITDKLQRTGVFNAKQYSTKAEVNNNDIIFTGKLLAESLSPRLEFTLTYTFYNEGVKIGLKYKIAEEFSNVPRVGIVFSTKKLKNATFFGYGPQEAYVDNKELSMRGEFTLSAEDLFTNYIKPQECGSHCDTNYLTLDFNCYKMDVVADKRFSFSVLPYSVDTLRNVRHSWELPKSYRSFVSLDVGMRGVGSYACGPELPEKYEIDKEGFNNFYLMFYRN